VGRGKNAHYSGTLGHSVVRDEGPTAW
jgi:hypothetical protein